MRTVLITGSSTGIGHAAVELFARQGWKVFAGSRHPENLHFDHPAIRPCLIDVNDSDSIRRCFEGITEPLDCVVNNAGYGMLIPFEDTPREEIEKMFRANVFGLMEVCRHAVRRMRERGKGTIVNISSLVGTIGAPWYAAYCGTKWAVEGFSESLAHEVSPFGIRIKLVEPSGTKTEFHKQAYNMNVPITEAYKERYGRKRGSQGGKSGYDTAEQIAALILQAATDSSERMRYGARQTRMAWLAQRLLGRDGTWKLMKKKFA